MMPADLVDVLGSISDVTIQETEEDEVDNVLAILFDENCDDG